MPGRSSELQRIAYLPYVAKRLCDIRHAAVIRIFAILSAQEQPDFARGLLRQQTGRPHAISAQAARLSANLSLRKTHCPYSILDLRTNSLLAAAIITVIGSQFDETHYRHCKRPRARRLVNKRAAPAILAWNAASVYAVNRACERFIDLQCATREAGVNPHNRRTGANATSIRSAHLLLRLHREGFTHAVAPRPFGARSPHAVIRRAFRNQAGSTARTAPLRPARCTGGTPA